MANVIEYDALTGELIERDFTPEEAKERAAQEAAAIEAQNVEAQAVADREAAKDSALAKLEALGLTTEEAQAIAGI